MEHWIAALLLLWTLSTTCGNDLIPGNWQGCRDGGGASPTRSNTSVQLQSLRDQMIQKQLHAYIVPSADFHLSEFVSAHDSRRQYISGFTGSAGTAVITRTKAALWTDGRYFLQAENELGCNWILMRDGEPGIPGITKWLKSELGVIKSTKTVGACPYFLSSTEWKEYDKELRGYGITLDAVTTDLIDIIWTENRPAFPYSQMYFLDLKYAGKSWQDKVADIFENMEETGLDALVITGLDETAWLFNLRASDIEGFVKDPFFYSYAILERHNRRLRLYLKDHQRKLSHPEKEPTVASHLHNKNGSCHGQMGFCVEVNEYNHTRFINDIQDVTDTSHNKQVMVSYFCNYAVYSTISQDKVVVGNTPAALMKAQKNDAERNGMRAAHIRDAAAFISFMAMLEKEVKEGKEWTEMKAERELDRYRRKQELSRGSSFAAISSVGPNSAINHYFVTNETDRKISLDETYLLDSGGQYLDGTTDVTRTFLFSEPTAFQKECYTRVLMGQINLAKAMWNRGRFGRELDAFARAPLWEVGLNYRHGTGHGIGAFLSVHEGPGRISNYHKLFSWDVPLDEYMFFSDEPGYYEKGSFGIRLENIFMVKKVETKYKVPGQVMLGFETVTLVPYEPHLIEKSIMDEEQLQWLQDYHEECLKKVGPLLVEAGKTLGYNWLVERTSVKYSSRNQAMENLPNLRITFLVILAAIFSR